MIFLYRFERTKQGMDFVLNEGLAKDMMAAPAYEEMLRPLVFSMSQTLSRFQMYSKSKTMMTGRLLDTGEGEVMLSEGLGQYIDDFTKHQIIFADARNITDILLQVMDMQPPPHGSQKEVR